MTRAQKIRDFIFGVVLIAGAALITCFVGTFAFQNKSEWLIPVFSGLAFIGACIWRKKHRALPSSFFVAEVVVAILACVLFFFMLFYWRLYTLFRSY